MGRPVELAESVLDVDTIADLGPEVAGVADPARQFPLVARLQRRQPLVQTGRGLSHGV